MDSLRSNSVGFLNFQLCGVAVQCKLAPARPSVQSRRMFDPASISAALGSAKAILDLLKGANDAQLAMRISAEVASVQGRLIEVQQQALDLQNENQNLRDDIRQLKTKLAETVEAEPCPRCNRKGW